jgi:predicted phosphoribosyltransferase
MMGYVVDEFVVVRISRRLFSIGQHDEDFRQVSDDEAVASLRRAAKTGRIDVGPVPRPR